MSSPLFSFGDLANRFSFGSAFSERFSLGGISYSHGGRRANVGRSADHTYERERFEREREREREKELYERDRERERLHARERDLMQYDLNSEDLLDEHGYGLDYSQVPPPSSGVRGVVGAVGGGVGGSGVGHPHLMRGNRLMDDTELLHERDAIRSGRYGGSRLAGRMDPRDLPPSAPITRRGPPIVDRDEYSPHRGGGSSRRMLNAM